jgi:hypothetical protein
MTLFVAELQHCTVLYPLHGDDYNVVLGLVVCETWAMEKFRQEIALYLTRCSWGMFEDLSVHWVPMNGK